jgi:2-oxoglutarate/2-oxoacid ferredoxin oxidoreductase subunit alpha
MFTGTERTIGLGGAAGDGLDTSSELLARAMARRGLFVYAYNSYQSVIRGGHIWLTVRAADQKVRSPGDRLDILVALNQDTIERHAPTVARGGVILFNGDKLECPPALTPEGVTPLPLPVKDILGALGNLPHVMQNGVLAGAAAALLGLDADALAQAAVDHFASKGEQVAAQNADAVRAGHAHATGAARALGAVGPPGWALDGPSRPYLSGNEAMALAAIAAGCRYYAAYPMTPVSNILHYLAAHGPAFGMVVKQCEDELAVINTTVGAGYAGARAMCATSGGGFALMTEAIGLAGMLEVPVVIVEGQRGGPSTGVPTKTEQGDLNQVLGASQGDYPRAVIAPTDPADAFQAVAEAFNLAEAYQMPVVVISDTALSEHRETVEPGDLTYDVPIDRGELVDKVPEGEPFLRYRMTPSGVSPRALPGTPGAAHVAASDEHDEAGILISDVFSSPPVRRKMHEKRMRKMEAVAARIPDPVPYGDPEAEVLLLGWGSTAGAIREAVELLGRRGVRAAQLQVRHLVPFPSEAVVRALARHPRAFVVEGNQSGQFARLMRAETGHMAGGLILKYDGEPFTPAEIAEEVQLRLAGRVPSGRLTEAEARETAYHFIRSRLHDALRPATARLMDGADEPVWRLALADRKAGKVAGDLFVGADTGAILKWRPAPEQKKEAGHGGH